MTRKAIGKQLNYLKRDLAAIDGKLNQEKALNIHQTERLLLPSFQTRTYCPWWWVYSRWNKKLVSEETCFEIGKIRLKKRRHSYGDD